MKFSFYVISVLILCAEAFRSPRLLSAWRSDHNKLDTSPALVVGSTAPSSHESSTRLFMGIGVSTKLFSWDLASVAASFVLLIGYHVRLNVREKNGQATWRSSQATTREKWSQYVRENEAWLYAIQTLRNAITANTFLATTVLSLLTVIGGRFVPMLKNGSIEFIIQFGLVALTMLMSAYEFLQSARLMTHAGFMFPVNKESTKPDVIMRKSQNGQWMGLRWLYLSVGAMAWMVGGGGAFIAASGLLTYFFHNIDQVPAVLDEDTEHIVI